MRTRSVPWKWLSFSCSVIPILLFYLETAGVVLSLLLAASSLHSSPQQHHLPTTRASCLAFKGNSLCITQRFQWQTEQYPAKPYTHLYRQRKPNSISHKSERKAAHLIMACNQIAIILSANKSCWIDIFNVTTLEYCDIMVSKYTYSKSATWCVNSGMRFFSAKSSCMTQSPKPNPTQGWLSPPKLARSWSYLPPPNIARSWPSLSLPSNTIPARNVGSVRTPCWMALAKNFTRVMHLFPRGAIST